MQPESHNDLLHKFSQKYHFSRARKEFRVRVNRNILLRCIYLEAQDIGGLGSLN